MASLPAQRNDIIILQERVKRFLTVVDDMQVLLAAWNKHGCNDLETVDIQALEGFEHTTKAEWADVITDVGTLQTACGAYGSAGIRNRLLKICRIPPGMD